MGAIVAISNQSEPITVLSEDEIRSLRKVYPTNDNTPELIDMREASLGEYIELCDSYLEVEVVSEPTTYVKRYDLDIDSPEGEVNEKIDGLSEDTWVTCTVRIINDIWNSIPKDTIDLTYNSIFAVGMPSMEIGSRFIIGGEYNTENGKLNISSSTMFYVTDDDYVLSVKSEESKNRYSGYKVDDFTDYIKKEKK